MLGGMDNCVSVSSLTLDPDMTNNVACVQVHILVPEELTSLTAHLKRGVHMGNFGEVKDSTLGPGVKMGHFSYIGNAQVGANTNIGAGTITCNYDGEKKYPTEIGEDVFIGSDTMLVAPVKLGNGARTGAGAVVTKNIPDDTLAVGMPARAIRKFQRKPKKDSSNNS
jgi:bifunctional UDP-N-acetylglucosamine pyrophosphorylase/glucosamine-1-phosphate N-acetyltransferase